MPGTLHHPQLVCFSNEIYVSVSPSGCISPASRLVSTSPAVLGVPKLLFHFRNKLAVTSVLADVVADLDRRSTVGIAELDDNVERNAFIASAFRDEIVGEEGPDAEAGYQTYLVRSMHVLDAAIHIQRVGKDNRLWLLDTFCIVECAHGLDKLEWIARVLSCTCKDFGVGRIGWWFAVVGIKMVIGRGGLLECIEEVGCSKCIGKCYAQCLKMLADIHNDQGISLTPRPKVPIQYCKALSFAVG